MPTPFANLPIGPGGADSVGGSGQTTTDSAQPLSSQERAVADAAQTVAQLEALIASNPDLADELADALAAAKDKLDQAVQDLMEAELEASGANPGTYAEYQAAVHGVSGALVEQYANDPVVLAALGRATQTMLSPDYLNGQLAAAQFGLEAYETLQAVGGRPVDPVVVEEKEAEIARLEALLAGAEAAQDSEQDRPAVVRPQGGGFFYEEEAAQAQQASDTSHRSRQTGDVQIGRVGVDPTATAD